MRPTIVATIATVTMTTALYVVLRSFAIDEGDTLDHVSTAVVAVMAFMAWARTITRK